MPCGSPSLRLAFKQTNKKIKSIYFGRILFWKATKLYMKTHESTKHLFVSISFLISYLFLILRFQLIYWWQFLFHYNDIFGVIFEFNRARNLLIVLGPNKNFLIFKMMIIKWTITIMNICRLSEISWKQDWWRIKMFWKRSYNLLKVLVAIGLVATSILLYNHFFLEHCTGNY